MGHHRKQKMQPQQQHRSSGGYQTTMRTSSKGPKNVERGKTREGNEGKATGSGNKVIFPKDRVPREVRASEHEITARRRRRRRRQEREAGKQETSFAMEIFLLTFMRAGRGAGGGIFFPFSSLALGAALGKGEIYCKSAILTNSLWAKTRGPPPGCLLSHLMGCLKISVSHYFCIL
jgi:hypothetical protein